ncbi:MAG: NADH-quinone oxidoreductase subunit NuoG [Anaerolineae bacterium]|nr:NADH-quinone oxidoreductase subunit NuoG [Anaerolineae bacterium]
MAKDVTLTIDGKTLTVPAGMLIVDAAKMIGVDIPVFCYHPKMEPVGMCRMCLVDIGRPMIDRATNQPVLDESGQPKIQFAPKLDTACTTPVSEGMVVITQSQKVAEARKDVVEFILTSHPLDCPICDKGGECPLQNLTMGFGPGESRFQFAEKMHMAKHVPLGDLIYLDRERCIQCARCVRFQSDVAGDPVIGFYNRGRSLEITTFSEPGFDSIFSGNTTDICPVGALTTADFRFGARPWELKTAASICSHCPVGCNTTVNIRREAGQDGKISIKRIMPRQNEQVNEIWLCDKGRFGYHYAESKERLTQPLVRKNGELTPVSWDEAIEAAAQGITQAKDEFVALTGGRLPNEDLFALRKLSDARGGKALLYSCMGGGDLIGQVGLASGSNLGELGKGSAVLVIASDLHELAPIWWLRLKAAAKRGATLLVAGARPTRLEEYASKVIRYQYGEELNVIQNLLDGQMPEFTQAENAIIFFGGEGMDMLGTSALAQACTSLLVQTNHIGRPNNGLVPVWTHANIQGAWDLGFHPSASLARNLASAGVVVVSAADPAGDEAMLADALDSAGFVIVQELFLTETARRADVVFPVQAHFEREGTFTSGERRVQRFYPAIYPPAGTRPDFNVIASVAQKAGHAIEGRFASLAFNALAAEVPVYHGLDYTKLAEVSAQWPIVGRSDLYYGGTTYDNNRGLGVHLEPACQKPGWHAPAAWAGRLPEHTFDLAAMNAQGALWLVPLVRLYDQGSLLTRSPLLAQHLAKPVYALHPETAASLGLAEGDLAQIDAGANGLVSAPVTFDSNLPRGCIFAPRSTGLPFTHAHGVKLVKIAAAAPVGD